MFTKKLCMVACPNLHASFGLGSSEVFKQSAQEANTYPLYAHQSSIAGYSSPRLDSYMTTLDE